MMKSLKLIIQEMRIDDINDVKFLTKTCFQFLMKTCYQWAKEHPIISGVLLFFYLLFIFYPFVFSILFYTFPLAICIAISLEEPQIISEKHKHMTKKKDLNNVTNTTRSICDFTSIDDDNKNRRTYLQTHMSRRTFGRLDNKNSNNNDNNNNNNNNILPNIIEEKTQIISTRVTPPSRSPNSTDSQSEEESTHDQERNKNVVEWTEHDEKNLMNLGSSEIERNKRLESLIAKRRARKMYSMQPRRPNFYFFDQHDQLIDHQVIGSIFVSEDGIYGDHQQPGSAPSVLLPTRNPFDLPYDPHEEKPILTGGSFDEEFYYLDEQHRDYLLKDHFKLCNNNNSNNYEISKMGEFFTKSRVVSGNNTGSTQFRRESDAEERLEEIIEELSSMREENGQAKEQHKDSHHEVQPKIEDKYDGDQQTFDNPFAIYNNKILSSNHFLSLPERNEKTKLTKTNNDEHNIFHMASESVSSCTKDDHPQPTQDHVVLSDYKGQIDDDDDEESLSSESLSSSPSSTSSSSIDEMTRRLNVTKNEAFRNSVRKVITCLAAFPRNNKDYLLQSSDMQGILTCNNTNTSPSKMQERSFYTEPHLHKSNFSIASDMQVEVSEGGSPPMTANEAYSPTDPGSYDGDVDKDVNSIDDEELWGVSPNPTKQGEFGINFKVKDNLDEDENVHKTSNLCNFNVHDNENDDPSPTLSISRVEKEEGANDQQGTIIGVVSSLSPRSILHNEGSKNNKVIVDVQSTNGDILESRLSSSSEELTSQMQNNKVDHLALYLANLPPSECGSNFIEDVEQSCCVREPNIEESFHDEINQVYEFDENKEESKEGSQRSSEESSTTSPIEEPKKTNSTSNNEFHAYDLNKEHLDQASSTTEQNDYIKTIEDEVGPLACKANENEVNSMPKQKESISDSNSTTYQEDFLDQLRLEDSTKIAPLNQVQDEREDELLSNQSDVDSDSQEKAKEASKDDKQ